jgi:hypothetical protein
VARATRTYVRERVPRSGQARRISEEKSGTEKRDGKAGRKSGTERLDLRLGRAGRLASLDTFSLRVDCTDERRRKRILTQRTHARLST